MKRFTSMSAQSPVDACLMLLFSTIMVSFVEFLGCVLSFCVQFCKPCWICPLNVKIPFRTEIVVPYSSTMLHYALCFFPSTCPWFTYFLLSFCMACWSTLCMLLRKLNLCNSWLYRLQKICNICNGIYTFMEKYLSVKTQVNISHQFGCLNLCHGMY